MRRISGAWRQVGPWTGARNPTNVIASWRSSVRKNGMDVVDNVVHQFGDIHTGLAALKARPFSQAVVSSAIHRAVNMFGVPLPVLLALKAIPRDGELEVGFEICNIAAVGLGLQRGIRRLPRR